MTYCNVNGRECDLSPFLWRQEAEGLAQTQEVLLPLLWTLPHVFGVQLHLLWHCLSSGSLMMNFHACSSAHTKEQHWILSQFQTALQTKCSSAFCNLLVLKLLCLVYFSQIRLSKLLWHCWFCLFSFLKISISSWKILLTFSFSSCLLHSETPLSMFGVTADSITTFPSTHPPSLQIFLSSTVHQNPKLHMVQYFWTPDFCPAETGSHYFECWSASCPHPASSQHHLPAVLLPLAVHFSLRCHMVMCCWHSPGPLPSFLADPAHPTLCLATALTPSCLFSPLSLRTLHSCVWAHCQTEL